MDKFFSIFGKITLILIAVSAFLYAGYYLGKNNIFERKEVFNISSKANDNKSGNDNTDRPKEESTNVSATEQPVSLKTIVAGLSKDKGLSFDEYSISIPLTWSSKKESQSQIDEKLILTKGEYSISIFQAATGGALCLYPNDSDFEGPSSRFENFVSLSTQDNRLLRRSGSLNTNSFTICQKSTDGSYQQPTSYGHISIKVPQNYDSLVIKEIDTILSSLKKIKN